MNHWNAGYVTDIGYTYGYYTELNPLRIQLALAAAGIQAPSDSITACELGFGQGVSSNIHAAATNVQWYGTDFNPSQAAFAQEMAHASGAKAHFYDQSFSEFTSRTDLPDFDFIALHGIWSWINDENRTIITDFIRRKLKVGGLLYVSYNTLPGWVTMAPMRHLMTEHSQVMGASGMGIVKRIDSALDFANKLLATNPLYTKTHPTIASRIKNLQKQNRHYLAHEYFNLDWHPMYFSKMGDWLNTAKLGFACSADNLEYTLGINLPSDQKYLLNEITDPMFRETVRDFVVNRQFRKDYWIKGGRALSQMERTEALRSVNLVLMTHRADVTSKIATPLGEITLHESVYSPILDILSDHQPKTIGQIERAVQPLGINLAQIIEIVMAMTGAEHLCPAQNESAIAQARPQCEKINAYFLRKSHSNGDITHLASPVIGGGVAVSRFEQLFLVALHQGKRQISELVEYVWNVLSVQEECILKEGKPLETPEENRAELHQIAQNFSTRKLPLLQALQII